MKIKYLFLPVAVAALAMGSCAKVLDTAPDGKISYDDVFADNDKTGAFLNNCYSKIPKCGYRYYFWTNWFVCTSDECFDNDADSDGSGMVPNNMYNGNISAGGTDIGNIGNGALYADAAAQSYWEAYWNAIWNCSYFISRIGTANVDSESDRQRWKAEAHVLNEYFCEWHDYGGGRDLETIWEDRNGNGQVYHIGGIGMQEGYKSGPVPTQEMVDAYPTNEGDWILDLSRPYLNVEHTQPNLNPNAKDSKNEAYSESDPYSCFRDPRFYASIYYHGSKRYTRWSFAEGEYAVNTFRAREIDCSQTDPWTGSDLKASTTNKRQRTRTGYYSRKYLNPTKNPTSPRNDAPGFKHFRFAEIILNYAEAAAEAGHTSDALEALKEIRDRVAMPHITTTDQAALIREIRAERRIELFFEEHRFFDIRRWQQPDGNLEDILHYTTAMQIDEQPNGTYTYQRIKIRDNGYACYTNKFLFLPLPLAEASRLESITGMNWQNPGW